MTKISWVTCTVQDFIDNGEAEVKTGPFGTQLHASDYVETGTPVINARNIGFGEMRAEKLEYISDETVQRLSSHLLEPSDIVFGRKGTVERHVFIQPEQAKWFQGTDCLRLRFKSPAIEPRFVSYCLLTEQHKQWIMNQSSHGATMTSLNQAIIGRISLRLPPLPTQRRIASILSAYDDLIENNTRRIRILEQMAQAIYREWFVEFRAPGVMLRQATSEEQKVTGKDRFPMGWEVKKVKDALTRLAAGNVYTSSDVVERGQVQVVDQSRDLVLGFHDNKPDHLASPDRPVVIFGDHTCKMQLMVEPFSVGPNVVPFIAANGMPTLYVYFLVNSLVETQEYKRHWTELTAKQVTVASSLIAEQFSQLVAPMFAQIDMLMRKNANLRQTRDLLLPRLVGGEVTVNGL